MTVLGHIQRGGTPSPLDRILSTRFGVAATKLVAKRQFGRMVCLKGDKISSVTLQRAVGRMKTVPPRSEIVQAARASEYLLVTGSRPSPEPALALASTYEQEGLL